MTINRRTLLRCTGMTAASLAARPAWAAAGIFRNRREARVAASDTILVVVQMGGGNDGLNTIVPFGDPAYVAARPRIGLTGSQVLKIDATTGLHPSLSNLYGYLNSGTLAIVQGVGYPGADMSHFRSDDIWEKASLEPETEPTGWLGRALDQLYRQDAEAIHAIAEGDVPAFRGEYVTTPTIGSGAVPRGDPDQMAALKALFLPAGEANRDYTGHIAKIAIADSEIIQSAIGAYAPTVTYPDDGPALQQIAALIVADVGARVFWVLQNGYDTHSNQLGDQEALLQGLDRALDAFFRDLAAHGQDHRVVVMTYSEFGRRVPDDASGGTDHGTAGPMFVVGPRVKGGLYGAPPSLTDLDPNGNLKFSIDFRQVYASILANWIDTDPAPVLSGNYPTISFL